LEETGVTIAIRDAHVCFIVVIGGIRSGDIAQKRKPALLAQCGYPIVPCTILNVDFCAEILHRSDRKMTEIALMSIHKNDYTRTAAGPRKKGAKKARRGEPCCQKCRSRFLGPKPIWRVAPKVESAREFALATGECMELL
jgi:hypothetical protein